MPDAAFLAHQTDILCASYQHWTGLTLMDLEPIPTEALFNAPFAIVSHGTEADPVFNYANRYALKLFGMTWAEITKLPSRKSVEPMRQEERAKLLTRVTKYGFVDDYAGVRIAKDGTRFTIKNACIWNLLDEKGNYCGQAAKFAL